MRVIRILLMVLCVFVAGPVLVSAQGLASGFGALQGYTCGPRFSLVDPSFSVGWVTNSGLTNYNAAIRPGTLVPPFQGLDYTYQMSAVYFEGTIPVPIGEMGTLLIQGSATVPSSGDSVQVATAGPGVLNFKWKTETFWGTLGGIYAYPVTDSLSALAGFRWDAWQSNYKNPDDNTAFLFHEPSFRADVKVNGFIPLVGLMNTWGGLTIGAMGFPVYPGNIRHREAVQVQARVEVKGDLDGGYFFETWFEYAPPFTPLLNGLDGRLAVFGKYNVVEASSSGTVRAQGTATGSAGADLAFNRQLFLVGAKMSLNFDFLRGNLPFL
jgi:hypothetical protein